LWAELRSCLYQVREVVEWLQQKEAKDAKRLEFEAGTVMRLKPVGMGDR
jgi:hypothetical protein